MASCRSPSRTAPPRTRIGQSAHRPTCNTVLQRHTIEELHDHEGATQMRAAARVAPASQNQSRVFLGASRAGVITRSASSCSSTTTLSREWLSTVSAVKSGSSDISRTSAIRRYPRLGRVSINRGLSAESPKAMRSFFTAVFKPLSNSTNVLLGHSRCWSSSRMTTSPARSIKRVRIWNGLS